MEILFWERKCYIYNTKFGSNPFCRLANLNFRDLKVEVFQHFCQTANIKKSWNQCLVISFAVWGSRLYGMTKLKLHNPIFERRSYFLERTLSLINCWTIFCRSIILKTVSISAKIEVNEWMKTKMAAISYQPRILSPKYEQMDNLKPLTVCSEMAKRRSLSLSYCIGCAVDWDVTLHNY